MRPKTSGSPKKQIQPNLHRKQLLTDSATLLKFLILLMNILTDTLLDVSFNAMF